MPDLRDQMLKAGLISEDQAKRATHETKQRNKALGREGWEKETAARKDALRQGEQARSDQDRLRAAEPRNRPGTGTVRSARRPFSPASIPVIGRVLPPVAMVRREPGFAWQGEEAKKGGSGSRWQLGTDSV